MFLNNSPMITKYKVIETKTNEVCIDNSAEEADTVVACLKEQNPYSEYKIEQYQESTVKPGFGRDPDLH